MMIIIVVVNYRMENKDYLFSDYQPSIPSGSVNEW